MDWTHSAGEPDVVTPSAGNAMDAPDLFAAMASATEPQRSALPFGPTFAPTNGGPAVPTTLPLPWDPKTGTWLTPNSFSEVGNYMLLPTFTSNDILRTSSQPAHKRAEADPMNWSTAQNGRDTLYAHEFLKAFRARMPDSAEGQAACDYCRKRKIRCDRKKPTCGHCAQSGRVCTSDDVLRKRGPPSKRERAIMDNAGIVFRSRNSRGSKYTGRGRASEQSGNTNVPANFERAAASGPDTFASLENSNGSNLFSAPLETTGLPAAKSAAWDTQQPWFASNDTMQGMGVAKGAGHANPSMDMTMLQNLPQHRAWDNAQHGWPSMAEPGAMLSMNLLNVPDAPSFPQQFQQTMSTDRDGSHTDDHTLHIPSYPSGMPSSVYPHGQASLPTTQPANHAPSQEVPMLRQEYTASSASTSDNDLSLLTKPIHVSNGEPLSMDYAHSPMATDPNAYVNEDDTIMDSYKTAISRFLSRDGAASLATHDLADYYTQNHAQDAASVYVEQGQSLLDALPATGIAADAICIRVVDRAGAIKFRPASSYYRDLASVHKNASVQIKFAGGTVRPATEPAGHAVLFPHEQWAESDYAGLRDDAERLLKLDAAVVLIGLAKQELQASLPLVQWDQIGRYLSAVRHELPTFWTPTQTRHRQALLLLLAAVASTLTPTVNVPDGSADMHVSASPWEFGHQCYCIARGLLAPRAVHLAADEQTLEHVQAMVLLVMYYLRCSQYDYTAPALAQAVTTCLGLVQNSAAPSSGGQQLAETILQKEMLKRLLYMLYLLARLNSVEANAETNTLLSKSVLSLETPVLLQRLALPHCRPDVGVSEAGFAVFQSEVKAGQMMAEADVEGVFSADLASVREGSPVHAAARRIHDKLEQWAATTPCIRSTPSQTSGAPPLSHWTTSAVFNMKGLFQASVAKLAQVAST